MDDNTMEAIDTPETPETHLHNGYTREEIIDSRKYIIGSLVFMVIIAFIPGLILLPIGCVRPEHDLIVGGITLMASGGLILVVCLIFVWYTKTHPV